MLFALLLSVGCATIVSKKKYPVHINSTPSNANLVIHNKHGIEIFKGKTPTTIELVPDAGYFQKGIYTLKFEKEGYDTLIYPLQGKIDEWYFGNSINLLFGTIPGAIGFLIVDPLTGAMWKLDITDINVNL